VYSLNLLCTSEVEYIAILWMRKGRLGDVKKLAQGCAHPQGLPITCSYCLPMKEKVKIA
jgi:hypothetical protein